jgi:hypothetical protein
MAKQISDLCKRIIQSNIEQMVYEEYEPEDYTRTFELLDAIAFKDIKMSGSSVSFVVFIDSGLLHSNVTDGWNQHADVYGGDTTQSIPEWIEEGTDSPLFAQPARPFMKASSRMLESRITQLLAQTLKSKGFKVTIS